LWFVDVTINIMEFEHCQICRVCYIELSHLVIFLVNKLIMNTKV